MAQFPQVAIARHLLQVLRAYQQEFGLTPAARPRLGEPPLQKREPDVPPELWDKPDCDSA